MKLLKEWIGTSQLTVDLRLMKKEEMQETSIQTRALSNEFEKESEHSKVVSPNPDLPTWDHNIQPGASVTSGYPKRARMKICRKSCRAVCTSKKHRDQNLQRVGWSCPHTQKELRRNQETCKTEERRFVDWQHQKHAKTSETTTETCGERRSSPEEFKTESQLFDYLLSAIVR